MVDVAGFIENFDTRALPGVDQVVASEGTLPAAQVYSGVAVGKGWSRTYETQTGVPIDGSKKLARDPRYGSPFTMRIHPPEVLLRALTQDFNDGGVNIIGAATKADSSFESYKDRLQTLRESSNLIQNVRTRNLNTNYISEGRLITPQNASDPENVRPSISDVTSARDVLLQLSQMLQIPPLTFLINPQNISIGFQKVQNYSDRSRNGYIFQSWGEEQPRLSVSAKTGAFIAGNSPTLSFLEFANDSRNVVATNTPTGVQWASRRNSAAFQNLLNVLLFFKNSGYIYDRVGRTDAHKWIGTVSIDYDQWTWFGSFDSFGYGYDENMQNGGMDFNFDMTVSRFYDNSSFNGFVAPLASPVPSPSSTQWHSSARERFLRQNPPNRPDERPNVSSSPATTNEGIEIDETTLVQPISPTEIAIESLNRSSRRSSQFGTVRGGVV